MTNGPSGARSIAITSAPSARSSCSVSGPKVEKLTAPFRDRIRTDTPVEWVRRLPDRVLVKARDMAAVIEKDADLAQQMVAFVNHPLFGLPRKVTRFDDHKLVPGLRSLGAYVLSTMGQRTDRSSCPSGHCTSRNS